MEQFEETSLWARTLANGSDSERTEAARERLRNAFLGFRKRAAVLAGEIPQNLRTLTVHDITHLDALWEVADTILGDDYVINPAEAFVLGGAILLHDLGMSLSSYNAGIDDLKKHPSWLDVKFNLLCKWLDRTPNEEDLSAPNPEIDEQVVNQLLRDLHAAHAADLAKIAFTRPGSDSYYLLEDVELRSQIGGLIGEIAYSHWWPIDAVAKRFSTKIGAFIFAPKTWTIDPLKIACVLRCSDACHLDGRRAPSFLMNLRKPGGISESHWTFQERLQKPTVENNRFVFTTSRPFQASDHTAWWLCFESLRMADRELRQSNTALADLGREQFLVQGIAGIDSAERLLRYIPAQGWEPVDINVRVTDVPALVKKLGGTSLYGQNPIVPLRELIQNGCDAVRARRIFESRAPSWGDVIVSYEINDDQETITVTDSGIGMSRNVLTGPLLDFGESYWNSRLANDELPGLARKGFISNGGFGIGFYSAFMWGNNVKVTTRSRNASPAETLVLHFENGLESRPVLRAAETAEQLIEPGTSVSVSLEHTSLDEIIDSAYDYSDDYYESSGYPETLEEIVEWICPVSDINIGTKAACDKVDWLIQANDWKVLSAPDLISRIQPNREIEDEELKIIEERMRPIVRDSEMVARLAISADIRLKSYSSFSAITAGILRSGTSIHDVAGIVLGRPSTASRSSAKGIITSEELRLWASEQLNLINNSVSGRSAIAVAKVIRRCGADTGPLHITEGRDRFLTFKEVAEFDWGDKVIFVGHAHYHNTKSLVEGTKLLPNALCIELGSAIDDELAESGHLEKSLLHGWRLWHDSLFGAVLEALSKNWCMPLDDLIAQVDAQRDARAKVVWGIDENGREFSESSAYIVYRK
ncbi:HD domain-containing protein [Massilia varians]